METPTEHQENRGRDAGEKENSPAVRGEEHAGTVVRLLPVAVLVLSSDRSFRAAATMLLTRRGCTVLSAQSEREALAMAGADPVDVIVIELGAAGGDLSRRARKVARKVDAAAARAGRRVAEVGIVIVGEAEDLGAQIEARAACAEPVLDKWGPFERLFQAVCDRDSARRLKPSRDAGSWPPAALRSGAV